MSADNATSALARVLNAIGAPAGEAAARPEIAADLVRVYEALRDVESVAQALNVERDTDIPGLPWWLPAEPGPVECATLGEAVRKALDLGLRRLGLLDGTDWTYHYDTDDVWIDGRRYVAAALPASQSPTEPAA